MDGNNFQLLVAIAGNVIYCYCLGKTLLLHHKTSKIEEEIKSIIDKPFCVVNKEEKNIE
jgi:hypothetical protein